MADPSTLLQALQSSYYKPSEMSAGIASQAIAGGIPALYNPYASSGSNFGVTLGAGLLSGLLGGYARSVAQEENAAMTPLIGQILQAPASERSGLASSNERLSPLVAALQFNDMERANKLQDAIQGKGIDLAYDPLIEQRKAQMMEPLELQKASKLKLQDAAAEQGIYTIGDQQLTAEEVGILDPIQLAAKKQQELAKTEAQSEIDAYGFNPKKEAEIDKLRKEFSALPEVKNFSIIEKTAGIVDKVLTDPNAVTDLELTRYAILAIEPGMAVREGEQAAVANSQSIPDALRGQWAKAMNGESSLDASAREGIKNLMIRAYEGHKQSYDRALGFFQKEAEAKNIEPGRISYIGESTPTDKLIESQAPTIDPNSQAAALAELKRRGLVP